MLVPVADERTNTYNVFGAPEVLLYIPLADKAAYVDESSKYTNDFVLSELLSTQTSTPVGLAFEYV